MGNGCATDDLSTIGEFEIPLQDLLAWQGRIHHIIDQYSDRGSATGVPLLDSTLCDMERLVAVVARLSGHAGPDRVRSA